MLLITCTAGWHLLLHHMLYLSSMIEVKVVVADVRGPTGGISVGVADVWGSTCSGLFAGGLAVGVGFVGVCQYA